MIIIKGKNTILEALRANLPIREIVVAQRTDHIPDVKIILTAARKRQIKITQVSSREFQDIAKDKTAQHIIAYAPNVQHHPLEKFTQNPKDNPILVMTDHLEDPFNFGAIMRSAYALGASGLIYPKDRQVSLTGGVMKASSGAAYHLPLCKTTNLGNTIDALKKAGYWIYGTDVNSATPLSKITLNLPCVILVGNENKGLSKRLKMQADDNILIEMKGSLDSLNVSVATGIILYTVCKQLNIDG